MRLSGIADELTAMKGPFALEPGISPAKETEHIVGDTGIHDDMLIVGGNQETTVALPDIEKIYV